LVVCRAFFANDSGYYPASNLNQVADGYVSEPRHVPLVLRNVLFTTLNLDGVQGRQPRHTGFHGIPFHEQGVWQILQITSMYDKPF